MKKYTWLILLIIGCILIPTPVMGNSELLLAESSLQDNDLVVFVRAGNLWLSLPDGSGLRQLTTDGGYSDPAWSRAGDQIAYVRVYTPIGSDHDATQVGIYDLETGQQRMVVPAQLTPFVLLGNYYQYSNPRWSPDGMDLYYIAWDGRVIGDYIHKVNVYTLSRDVNFTPFFTRGFDVSPTSGWIVFTEFFNGIPVGYNLNISSPDGRTRYVIIPLVDEQLIASPRWSPDGGEIAFAASGASYGSGSIAITSSSGTLRHLYPVGITSVLSTTIDWSPNGTWFVYDLASNLYLLNLEDGNTSSLISGEDPSWGASNLSISGRITHVLTGDPISDVVVSDGMGHTATTNSDGIFVFSDLPPGTYTITPSREDLLFSPRSHRVSLPPDATGINFIAGGDTDGDGLNDHWEVNGFDADGDGNTDVNLPAMGADPLTRDIFVEIDYMVDPGVCIENTCLFGHTHEPAPQAMDRVVQSFRDQGIHLHIDYGQDAPLVYGDAQNWGDLSRAEALEHLDALNTPQEDWGDPDNWPGFDRIKVEQGHFSTERYPIFHYAIFAHDLGGNLSGRSGVSRNDPSTWQAFRQGASDFVVITRLAGNITEQGGTFMHELGHNLGLIHSGNEDDLNFEPNYLSVMNYLFQMDGLVFNQHDGRLDYSRFGSIPDLDENHLDETEGLNGGTAIDAYGTRYFCSVLDILVNRRVTAANDPINWDCSLIDDPDPDISTSINHDASLDTLIGFDDWPALVFDGGEVSNENVVLKLAQGSTADVVIEELSFETADAFDQPYDISLEADNLLIVYPGLTDTIPITLTNTGRLTTTISLSYTTDVDWFAPGLLPDQVTLNPGETSSILIGSSIPSVSGTGELGSLILEATPLESPLMGDRIGITAQVGPMAWFEAIPVSGISPHEVSFTDLSAGEITSWQWDFGDGSLSNQQDPVHVYRLPGIYEVSLTVMGSGGSHTFSRQALIHVSAHQTFMPLIVKYR